MKSLLSSNRCVLYIPSRAKDLISLVYFFKLGGALPL